METNNDYRYYSVCCVGKRSPNMLYFLMCPCFCRIEHTIEYEWTKLEYENESILQRYP